AALPRSGQNRGDDVNVPMIPRARLFQNGVLVKPGMRCRIVSAAESLLVRLLFAVVRKWEARNLPSSKAASVGERGQENRIHGGPFLQNVECLLGALVYEGN